MKLKLTQMILCCTLLLLSVCAVACTDQGTPVETQGATRATTLPSEVITNEPATEPTTEPTTQAHTESQTQALTQAETSVYTEVETQASTEAETQSDVIYDLQIAKKGLRRSKFRLVFDTKADTSLKKEADMIAEMVKAYCGTQFLQQDASVSYEKEIILCDSGRPDGKALLDTLQEGEFAIRADIDKTNSNMKVYLAATSYRAYVACIEYLLDNHYTAENGLCIPSNLSVNGTVKDYTLITSTINKLRDPCILVEDGVYYAYGTGWKCYKNTSGNLEGPWTSLGKVASVADESTDGGSHWAPEVHKYNGAYYMFTTYLNAKTNHRGCTIMKSNSPEGPFVEITGGHITPSDWDAIDGTLYVDPDGQPWMVFVHEWTSMPDGVGSFAAAKLSDDLTHFISEPIELFKANEPSWAIQGITDGCWIYTTQEGELLMLWSNFDAHGYVVAVARSSNGRLDGEWIHEEKLLYSKYMTGTYDGGHAMIFTDADGQMYLAFHSPNTATDDRKERPVFLAIKEEDGKLVWDEPKATS